MSKQRNSGEMFPLIEEWERSGQSQKEFCSSVGVAQHLMSYWVKKYREEAIDEKSGFTEIKASSLASPIEICYPNGVVVRLSDPKATGLLKTLIGLI